MRMMQGSRKSAMTPSFNGRIAVMYVGKLAEIAPAEDLFASPKHPYTQGLLGSVPRLDQDRSIPLAPIKGNPADPFMKIPGCRFHPRCDYAAEICRHSVPVFDGRVACHFPLDAAQREAS